MIGSHGRKLNLWTSVQAGHYVSIELSFAIVRRVLLKMINAKDFGDFRGAILTEIWN